MRWPQIRVEQIPPSAFTPPHCPWPECAAHDPDMVAGWRFFSGHGAYQRKCDGRTVPRFLCRYCGRSFSQQTFATSYYLHRPELTEPVASQAVEGSCIRQTARHLEQQGLSCSKSTVAHHLRRVGRHALLLHSSLVSDLTELGEPVIYDDFETFAHSLLYPLAGATAVGAFTKFWYYADIAQHRPRALLKGHRQRRLEQLDLERGKVSAGGVSRQFDRMIHTLLDIAGDGEVVRLITDGAPIYHDRLQRIRDRERVRHTAHANPAPGARRDDVYGSAASRDRAMSPNDRLHQLLRHARAHNRRKTIAYSRRHNDHMLRDALTVVWRNMVKRSTEQRVDAPTPGMLRGVASERWTWTRVLARRLFPSLVKPPERAMHFYRGDEITLPLPVNRRHSLKNAF